jgi:hypothetical protein
LVSTALRVRMIAGSPFIVILSVSGAAVGPTALNHRL